MKNLAILALAVSVGLGMGTASFDAEAKRLGGSRSTGMQRALPAKTAPTNTASPATAPSQAAAPAAAGAAGTAAAAQKRSWMGPLAGLAAGLGLAALASHLGFGEGLANIMLIALIAMVGFWLFRRFMGGRPQAKPAMAGAAGGMSPDTFRQEAARPDAPMRRESHEPVAPAAGGSIIGSALGSAPAVSASAQPWPADFDADGFVRNAKGQFIRLQLANDQKNTDDIRRFCSPEMVGHIQMEWMDRGQAAQETKVLSLDAEVLQVVTEDGHYIVTARYWGWVQEAAGTEAEAFNEAWHWTKPTTGNDGWTLAGIQPLDAEPARS